MNLIWILVILETKIWWVKTQLKIMEELSTLIMPNSICQTFKIIIRKQNRVTRGNFHIPMLARNHLKSLTVQHEQFVYYIMFLNYYYTHKISKYLDISSIDISCKWNVFPMMRTSVFDKTNTKWSVQSLSITHCYTYYLFWVSYVYWMVTL